MQREVLTELFVNYLRKMAVNTCFSLSSQDNWDDDDEEKEAKVEVKKTGMFLKTSR